MEVAPVNSTLTVSLDGQWLLAPDPGNVGRQEGWFDAPRPDARETKVPWIIQDAFPGYHGAAWYWRDFTCPVSPHAGGRVLLRFWAVDYLSEVWVNGQPVGGHEGGETPFTLDVTAVVKLGAVNRLAVRVLNPTNDPIDGYVLRECPGRNKAFPYSAGNDWNHGGIVDSVELLTVPAVRVADVFARAVGGQSGEAGVIRVQVTLQNAAADALPCRLQLTAGPASSGETFVTQTLEQTVPPGETVADVDLPISQPDLWNLNDPHLYRVTARVQAAGSPSYDESSVRCGFREFRFEGGTFRLNGKRLFLKCSHTGNCCPVGQILPADPDWLRRDLLNVKVMGFNAIRFIAGMATRRQLDFCDELGLMVYQEPYGAWCLADSPHMKDRYDRGLREMVLRDRNHPSVTVWGLLNETGDGAVFRNAAAALPWLRDLDDTRLVLLNSGRWDDDLSTRLAGLMMWQRQGGPDPNVTCNPTAHPITGTGMTWQPGNAAFHPGPAGEYSVARWTAPRDGEVQVSAAFANICEHATTDVHVLHNAASLLDAGINVNGGGDQAGWSGTASVQAGDTLDCVVGWGNGHFGGDSTGFAFVLRMGDTDWDVARDFSVAAQPNGPWSYGWLAHGAQPDAATFTAYPVGETKGHGNTVGTLSNPGSRVWEDVLSDKHPYQRVPHTAAILNTLRTINGGDVPLFISEYGIGSAVDLVRAARDKLNRFMADWDAWKMEECFARPEDFFAASNARMGDQRLLGINAIRSNPGCVGYSLTGTVDQGMSGEGLFTTFRELKPGTVDAVFEGLAPLRLCAFAEPINAYRGQTIHLEAVLQNEDALAPGTYPVRVEVVGPGMVRPLRKLIEVTVPDAQEGFVIPVLAEDFVADGPSGEYRLLVTLDQGGAATGGDATFRVTDPADMPAVGTEVVLWGNDPGLARWLTEHDIANRPFTSAEPAGREVILVGTTPVEGGVAAWRELAARMARGATVVFLYPAIWGDGGNSTRWLPLAQKGAVVGLNGWLYHKDEWAKPHPVFDGLQAGGLMDYFLYREVIPDVVLSGASAPAEAIAGANNASIDYSSGLLLAAYDFGAGRFLASTLVIRELLGTSPVAERLLRNLLNSATRDAGRPLAPLPADFEATLRAVGYE
jgi:hypothetical protein